MLFGMRGPGGCPHLPTEQIDLGHSVLRFCRVPEASLIRRGGCRVGWRIAAQGRIFRKNLSREPEKRPAHARPNQDRECEGAPDCSERLVAVEIEVRPYQRDKGRRRGKTQGNTGAGDELGQNFSHVDWCGPASRRFNRKPDPLASVRTVSEDHPRNGFLASMTRRRQSRRGRRH
jgi:hypothetical protein